MRTRRFLATAIGVLVLALVLGSCTLITTPTTGSITVTVKSIAPWVVTDKDAKSLAEPKAWIYASHVKFDLYNGASIVDTWTVDPSVSIGGGSSTLGAYTESGITAGTYTKLVVSVFNDNFSLVVPVVEGTEFGVTVTAGYETPLNVTCLPMTPTIVSKGLYSYVTLSLHGERWYQITTTASSTQFLINTVSGDGDLYIFDQYGNYVNSQTSPGTGVHSVTIPTGVGQLYLVGIYGYVAGQSGVTFMDGP